MNLIQGEGKGSSGVLAFDDAPHIVAYLAGLQLLRLPRRLCHVHHQLDPGLVPFVEDTVQHTVVQLKDHALLKESHKG